MKSRIIYLFTFLFFTEILIAQQMPSFSSKGKTNAVCDGSLEDNNNDAFLKVKNICKAMDIEGNFIVAECGNVDNYKAVLNNNGAYIFYNKLYLQKILGLSFTEASFKASEKEDWDVACILAHEIGHHVLQHLSNYSQLLKLMSERDLELQADKFAGAAMYRLGATLEQAQQVMYSPSVSLEGSRTHPSRKERLEYLAMGYNGAKAKNSNSPVKIEKSESEIISDAIGLWSEGKHKEAVQVFEKYEDNEKVWSYLATAHFHGIGTELDYEKAFTFYSQSADAGNADAQYNMGMMYYYGTGAPQKYDLAIKYFNMAVQQGHPAAMNMVGEMHFYGKGVPTDFNAALTYYTRAADEFDASALLTLGKMYYEGLGVDSNLVKAFEYFNRLANLNDSDGEYWCGKLYESGEGVAANLQEAIRLYKLSAKQNNVLGVNACKRLNVLWK